MRKKSIDKKGFSLIELLATILIISIILGTGITFVTKTINKSKERSQVLALNNIKKTANTYVEEYSNDIAWIKEKNNSNSYSCISVNSLINKGYLSDKDISSQAGISSSKYVIISRDQSKNIVSQEIDTNNKCSQNIQKVEIPTAKKYCNNLYYNGSEQLLVTTSSSEFTIDQNQIKKTDAGNYTITAKLNSNNQINNKTYTWSDDTTADKTFTCTIKKQVPKFNIAGPTQGETGKSLIDTKISLSSNIPGTIQIKSSNKVIATAILDTDNKIVANTLKDVTIKKYATKSSTTYITFTLTPTDSKNYAETTTIYTIGKIKLISVSKPTCNKNLYYNFGYQNLIAPASQYTLLNNIQKEEGEYNVTAKLKYGYIWKDDNSTNDYQTKCKIETATLQLSYNDNGGSGCSTQKKAIYFNKPYGTLTTLCTPSRTGYTFNIWNTEKTGKGTNVKNETIVTSKTNHTIYAQWKANTYTIKYNGNGGTGKTNNSVHTYNVSKKLTANGFFKTGYTFNGWNTKIDGSGTSYSNQQFIKNLSSTNNATITLYAQWKAKTYTIKYNGNGGTGSTADSIHTYDVGKKLTANGFSKTGYIFNGWNTKTDGSGTTYSNQQPVKNLSSTNNATITLYAKWKANTYTIKYNENGGTGSTADSIHTYDVGKKLTANGFSKTGYTFNGWNTKTDGSRTSYSNQQSVKNLTSNNDVTIILYAQWTKNTYILTFNGNGGSKCNSKNLNYNEQFGTLCTPTRTGYTFKGWYTQGSGGTKVASTNKITQDTTIYAQWTINTYTLTFDSNGGSKCNSKNLNYNEKFGTLCTSTKTGYTFKGWYTQGSGGTKVASTNKITQDTTIYAQWTKNTYILTFNGNGGSKCNSKNLNYNEKFGTLCTPTRAGYRFDGWYTKKSGGIKVKTTNKITKNTTVYAHWIVNICTIHFSANDGTFKKDVATTITKKSTDKSFNMWNANGGTFGATRPGYHTVDGRDWISSDNRTFNEDNNYTVKQLCPDIDTKNQTINLKVNWYSQLYYFCRNGNTCRNNTTSTREEHCVKTIYSTNENPQSITIINTATSPSGGLYYIDHEGYYIWNGCLKTTKDAARTDCPRECI